MKLIEQKIEALLFFKNEPVSYDWLSKKTSTPVDIIKDAIVNMEQYYTNRGFHLVHTNDSVALMTAEVAADIIAEITRQQENKELSKQALETLSIIMYQGQITKAEIDFIRGVNSMFILRNLLIRGLISKKPNLQDKRAPLYIPTHDLFSFLGISSAEQLPGHEKMSQKLTELEMQYHHEASQEEEILVVGDNE